MGLHAIFTCFDISIKLVECVLICLLYTVDHIKFTCFDCHYLTLKNLHVECVPCPKQKVTKSKRKVRLPFDSLCNSLHYRSFIPHTNLNLFQYSYCSKISNVMLKIYMILDTVQYLPHQFLHCSHYR